MINKHNLWFLTLFSLILVLSVYYITMPNELLLTNNTAKVDSNDKSEKTSTVVEKDTSKTKSDPVVSVKESEVLTALRVNLDEEREAKKKDIQTLLTGKDVTTEEKNNAYDELKQINDNISKESNLEEKIKKNFKFPSFVKIDGSEITVVIDNDKHDMELANNIMRSIQEEFKDKVYITVQFK